ncbi:MAG: HEAT repeat domain-containing protein [bacterium]|nr:HEAT repeat domain-containing protein [bacterium]
MEKILFVLLILISANSALAKSDFIWSKSELVKDKVIAGLYDENWSVRLKSALVLGKSKNINAVRPLVQTLSDDNIYVREYAAKALIQIGKPSFDLLTISIKDVDWFVRQESAYALSEIDGVRAVSFLVEALRDEDSRVTDEVKKALIKIGKPAVDRVMVLLNDPNGDAQRNAGYVLSKIGKPAVEPLIKTLKNSNCYVVVEAIWSLGEIGDNRSVDPLVRLLKNENNLVRWEAISALGKIGDDKIVKFIKPLLNDQDNNIRTIAKEVMERLKNNTEKKVSMTASKYL